MIQANLYPLMKPPKRPYSLSQGFTIAPFKRVALKRLHQKSEMDSVELQGDVDEPTLRLWLVFHTFTLADGPALRHYEMGYPDYTLEVLDQECADHYDYEDVLPSMFLTLEGATQVPSKNYGELFDQFCELAWEDLDQVRTCLLDFSPKTRSSELLIRDSSYWGLMASYSVVEYVIGEQPSTCDGVLECPKCKKKLQKHRPLSEEQWVRDRLQEIMGEGSIPDSYAEVIFAVRDKIRNKTVHRAKHPSAVQPELEAGITAYPASRAIEEFRSDAIALAVLVRTLREIARRLLLNKVFQLGVFPRLSRSFVAASGHVTVPSRT